MFNSRPAARILRRGVKSARAARSYASARPRPAPTAPASSSSAGQSLVIAAATLTVGGLILSQRGRVINDAKGRKGRDVAAVEEPIYVKDDLKPPTPPSASPAPEIVTRKEEEAEQSQKSPDSANQGAFNEETGEINWDCPCLGGMADGPCGEQFKAAFSCFVYSEAEPKGVDCVEKFKAMQDCFREHPDVYGEEIEDDEQAKAEAEQAGGEDIGSVDAPSIKAEAAQGASVGTA